MAASDRPMPNWAFRVMALLLRLWERSRKPRERLERVGLERGQIVLEYGCGVGSFTIPAARIVGEKGLVYAADIHPLALKTVDRRIRKEGLGNVETILTDRDTGLPDESVDVVLLYDTLHLVGDKQALLQELHRVLKADGFLSSDHDHTAREDLLKTISSTNLFRLQAEYGKVFNFSKQ